VRDYLAGKTDTKTGTRLLRKDEEWCIYMKYKDEPWAQPLIKELRRKEEGIMRAEKALVKVDRSYLRYVRSMNIMKNDIDRAFQYKRMVEEYRAQNKTEVSLEIARKLLRRNRPIDEIIEDTGLTRDEIESLCEKKGD